MADNPASSDNKEEKQNQPSSDDQWLAKMLPFITKLILALTLFFFSATIYQLFDLNSRVEDAPSMSIESTQQNSQQVDDATYQWQSLVALEIHVLQQRYHQANVLLMARIWVRYLGFITGMMLSIIGAIFVLGKLREPSTEMSISGTVQAQIVTQSPGVLLALLGSVIMLTTIVSNHRIEVSDGPVYIPKSFSSSSAKRVGTSSAPMELCDNALDPSDDAFLDCAAKRWEKQKAEENAQ